MEPTKVIKLNANTVSVITELRAQVVTYQQKIAELNKSLTDLLTGVCLSNEVDLNVSGVNISDDLSELRVFPLNKSEDTSDIKVEDTPAKKARVKKM